MRKQIKIKTKLIAYIVPLILLSFVFNYIISIKISKNMSKDRIEKNIENFQNEETRIIELYFNSISDGSTDLAAIVAKNYKKLNAENFEKSMTSIVSSKIYVDGLGVWFEPENFENEKINLGTHVYEQDNSIKTANINDIDSIYAYRYFDLKEYEKARDERRTVFTKMYKDRQSGIETITAYSPMYTEKNKFIGCVTIDIYIGTIMEVISTYTLNDVSNYIINSDGKFIIFNDLIDGSDELYDEIRLATSDNNNSQVLKFDKEKYFVYHYTINDIGWKIVYIIPNSQIDNSLSNLRFIIIISITASLIMLMIIVLFLVYFNVEKPLNLIIEEFTKISRNLYDTEVPKALTKRKDEFGTLGNVVGNMKIDLQRYHSELEDLIDYNSKSAIELRLHNELLQENHFSVSEAIKYHEAIISALPLLVFMFTRDGYCIDCQGNSTIELLPKSMFINKHISDILNENDSKAILESIGEITEGEPVRKFDISLEVGGIIEHFSLNMTYCVNERIMIIANRLTNIYNHLKEIEYLSYSDQLTGLHNRRHFDKILKKYVEESFLPLSIIISDVNGLKLINDSFGHEQGDKFLIKYANVLRSMNIDMNNISRTGGDEFTILLPNTTSQEAKNFISRISKKCSEHVVKGIVLSVSFGHSTISSETESVDETIKLAEDIMYQNKTFESSSGKNKTIDLIVKTLQEKNPREQSHSNRVALLCEKMAEKLNFTSAEKNKIRIAGLLHDIGKIGIPEELLNKEGKLTLDEYEEIKKHPEIGYRILKSAGNTNEVSQIILSHHERWDGKGYPRQLQEEEIPFESRIICIVDAYDAMTSDRSYRVGMPKEVAIDELIRSKGVQFDPELVDIFIDMIQKDDTDNL